MPEKDDKKKFPFNEDDARNNREIDLEAEDLRRKLKIINDKVNGKNSEPATNKEILQYLQVINFNFISLTQLLQTIYLKNAEIHPILANMALAISQMQESLQQFFETSSMIDDTLQNPDNIPE